MPGRRPQLASSLVYVPGDLEHDGRPEHAAIVTGLYPDDMRVDLWVFFHGGPPCARAGIAQLDPSHHTGWRWPTPERPIRSAP